MLYLEMFVLLKDARKRERYYKSTSGRREIKKFLIEKFGEVPEWPNGAAC